MIYAQYAGLECDVGMIYARYAGLECDVGICASGALFKSAALGLLAQVRLHIRREVDTGYPIPILQLKFVADELQGGRKCACVVME